MGHCRRGSEISRAHQRRLLLLQNAVMVFVPERGWWLGFMAVILGMPEGTNVRAFCVGKRVTARRWVASGCSCDFGEVEVSLSLLHAADPTPVPFNNPLYSLYSLSNVSYPWDFFSENSAYIPTFSRFSNG